MNKFIYAAETRKQVLKGVISNKNKALARAVTGRLKICGNSCYHVTEAPAKCTYINKANSALVTALAQKSYDEAVLKAAQKELAALESRRLYSGVTFEDVYETISDRRKPFITPDILTDSMYTDAWLSRDYEKPGFRQDATRYKTDNGEYVRSKSEAIIANLLLRYNLPYLYEYPVTLKSGRVIHPDFNILVISDRSEKFLEHLGMMDNANYAQEAVLRLGDLAKIDIISGKNLILTMECSRIPLNTEALDIIIRENFLF